MKPFVCAVAIAMALFAAAGAQAPSAGRAGGPTPATTRPDATLLQVMRGIVYPSSNVVFAGQNDISSLPKSANPPVDPNLLTSTYGGWTAVENASLALAESARLLMVAGRTCSNGKPVPVQRSDWIKFTNSLRAAGLKSYKAAQSKNTDAMVEASGDVADACQACHEAYREKPSAANRCTP
jgi:hypothetical protein